MKHKARYETFISRFLVALMALIMCITLFPTQAYAWKNLTHVNSADIILLELKRAAAQNNGRAAVTIYDLYDDQSAGYTYEIPREFKDALFSYPDAFRAGSMGPDFYPDMLTGQGYIHPYDDAKNIGSGEWITLLCDSVNRLPYDSNERKEALAFTLGFMLHYCGDMFGHDFINQFAGGTYPFLEDAANEASSGNTKGPNLNIIFSHMATETYMDSLLDWDFYARSNKEWLNIKAPTRFITDTLVFDGSVNSGAAKIFKRYGSVPAQYTYLIDLRQQLYDLANDWRESTDVFKAGAVKFIDRWVEDLDRATEALVECFDNMARRMVTTKPSELSTTTVVREELMKWKDDYGSYITPVPDVVVDSVKITKEITTAITDALKIQFVEDINKWIEDQIIDIALNAMGMGSLLDVVEGATERMEDPSVQLDHEDNPFKPAANNFAEFKEYMDRYAKPQKELAKNKESLNNYSIGESPEILDKLINSDLEAFYNTMVMFKLILIGPENFEDLIDKLSGGSYSGSKRPSDYYHGNTGYLSATNLRLSIKTLDAQGAGTDDNIFAVVYKNENGKKTRVARKLLDKSNYNDFERGDNDDYDVELSEPVRCDQIEITIQQRTPSGLGGGLGTEWDCENIYVTPMHAGKTLHGAICVGGKTMNSGDDWDLKYMDEIQRRKNPTTKQMTVTRLYFDIETADVAYAGTDADVMVSVYNGDRKEGDYMLDLPNYNDFERKDHDYYNVYLKTPVPLENLEVKFWLGGLNDDWKPYYIKCIPYHYDVQLAGDTRIFYDDWIEKGNDYWMKIQEKVSPWNLSPLARFDYETSLDDGLASYVNSLDDSRQWINDSSLLWNDKTVREEVFFKIFKGFAPEIGYSGPESVAEGEAINIELSFTGMWNGIRQARRDAVSPGSPMPAVKGSARISFINDKGEEACYLDQAINGGSISVSDYANDALKAGVYDIKVTFAPDSGDPQYSGAESVFEKALRINRVEHCTVSFSMNGHGNAPKKQTIKSGGQAKRPDDPSETGWIFKGWYKESECVTAFEFTESVSQDIILYAKWEATHTHNTKTRKENETAATCSERGSYDEVVYCEDCGATVSRETKYTEIDKNAHKWGDWTSMRLPTVLKTGEDIRYCEHDLTHNETREVVKLESIKIGGDFRTAYTVGEYFDPDGMVVTAIYSGGTERMLNAGDYTVASGRALTLDDVEIAVSYTEDNVKITVWTGIEVTPPKFSVTVNGGMADKTMAAANETVTIMAFPMAGREFDEWVVNVGDISLDNKSAARTTFTMPAEKVEVTATYQPKSSGGDITTKYMLTCQTNGGSEVEATKHNRGTTVNLTATPTREGYTFDGWYADEALANKITSVKMDGNKTVYAGWKENTTSGHDRPSEHLKDVDSDAWYHEYVDYVVSKGLMQGVADDEFAPGITTTRAMIVTILHRLEGKPAAGGKTSFDDVVASSWYADAVAWGEENNIVEGYGNGKFGPSDYITREQFAAIMYRYSAFKGYDVSKSADLSGYADASDIGDWALPAMKWANAEGLITGRTDTTLVPGGDATRAEAAAILMRYIEK